MSRPHAVRLLKTLDEIRKELVDTVQGLTPEEFGWAPAEGMKSYAALLQEIGTMEKLTTAWLTSGQELPWDMAAYVRGDSAANALADLAAIRTETLAYLHDVSEEKLETPVAVPAAWQQYWGAEIEPEEGIRWVALHEYYHLGQMIIYRWQTGHNPYKGEAW